MGSPADEEGRESIEGPQHKVRIGKPFGVGKFETTFAEWDACVTGGGCKHKPSDNGWGRGKRAVSDVSWDAITKEFLPWLSRKTGKTYRLLTEEEWEYAARAGSAMPFSTGMTISPEQANFDGRETFRGSAKGQYRQRPIEVGSFQANAFGLHDLHGNVWEWVEDCYKNSYAGAPSDGSAVVSGDCSMRVMRGGSWASAPRFLRAASRSFFLPDLVPEHGTKSLVPDINWGEPDHGFRLARTLSP
jgi:formylglycine-generating enzyme required for sulfatase activity